MDEPPSGTGTDVSGQVILACVGSDDEYVMVSEWSGDLLHDRQHVFTTTSPGLGNYIHIEDSVEGDNFSNVEFKIFNVGPTVLVNGKLVII